jgi:hypothetical protein
MIFVLVGASLLAGCAVGAMATRILSDRRAGGRNRELTDALLQQLLDNGVVLAQALGHAHAFVRLCWLDSDGVPTRLRGSSNDPYPDLDRRELCDGVLEALRIARVDSRRTVHSCDESCDPSQTSHEWWLVVPVCDAVDQTDVIAALGLVERGRAAPNGAGLTDVRDQLSRQAATVALIVTANRWLSPSTKVAS